MLRSVRRGAALVAVPALALAALAATPGTASAAGTDPVPVNAAATWIAGQVPAAGLFPGSFGPDYGLSIDVALGLDGVGSGAATVTRIRDALAADVNGYIAYSYNDGTADHSGETGGATAKALLLAQRTGGNVLDFGGVDLVERLESLIADDGRVISTFDGAPDASYDNTYIQTLALDALDGTGSSAHGKLVDYLLDQQCVGGFFRGDIAEDQEQCLPSDAPDTDATAQAVVALLDETGTEAVNARTSAVQWLLSSQGADGSFGGGTGTETANANSTGLAADALRRAGQADAAAEAAVWLRRHQAVAVGSCFTFAAADLGAVTYDDTSLAEATSGAMSAELVSQSIRATAQALPALLAAPAGTGIDVLFTSEYVKAGTKPRVGVIGAAPGEPLCATVGKQKVVRWADANGEASFPVTISKRTATTRVTVYDVEAKAGVAAIRALGAKKLPVAAKAKIKKGKRQKVTVRGLAAGESVKVKLLGKTKRGQATKRGVFTTAVKVTGKPRKVKVTVVGEFGTRTGSKTFKVVR